MSTFLALSWGVSRGRETYGYSIRRLTDTDTGRVYRTCGGGYDMTGTVLGKWLADRYAAELTALVSSPRRRTPLGSTGWQSVDGPGGLSISPDGKIRVDGMVGESAMRDVAAALGLEIRYAPTVGRSRVSPGLIVERLTP